MNNILCKRILPLSIAVVSSFALLISGCSSKTSLSTNEKKEDLILAVGKTDTGLFDPKKGWGTHAQLRLTHSSLLRIDSDMKFVPDLATSYEVSSDGLTWTFPLRKDVKFSDGKTLRAEDVKFTYEMLQKDGIKFDLTFMKSIEVKDENTISIVLHKPRSTFVSQLTEIGIVPKDLYDDTYSDNPIGSGPYKVAQYNSGQQIILKYNEHWYGTKPQFKKLTLLLLGEDAALAAAKAKEADIVYVPPTFANQNIEGMKLLRFESVDSRGMSMPTLKRGGKGKLNKNDVNVGNDVTSDLSIRKALNIGLSRDAIIDVALEGYGKKAFSVFDTLPWFNEKTVVSDGDIAQAKKILSEGGWKDTNQDGIVEKGNLKAEFDLLYNASDQLRSDMALAIADMAKKLGIQITTKGMTWDEIFVKGKENAVIWGGGRHHPHPIYTTYHSSVINQGYNNLTHYTNPVVDSYLDKAVQASNQEEANRYWKLAQWDGKTGFSALGDTPIIWLTRIDHLYLANEKLNVGKQPVHSHGHEWALFGNITDWTWEK